MAHRGTSSPSMCHSRLSGVELFQRRWDVERRGARACDAVAPPRIGIRQLARRRMRARADLDGLLLAARQASQLLVHRDPAVPAVKAVDRLEVAAQLDRL